MVAPTVTFVRDHGGDVDVGQLLAEGGHRGRLAIADDTIENDLGMFGDRAGSHF